MFDVRILLTILMIWTAVIEVHSIFLPKRADNMYIGREKILPDPRKRPFCNAFTGCGRKRSNLAPLPEALNPNRNFGHLQSSGGNRAHHAAAPPLRNFHGGGGADDETINSLLDLNVEPAVEDLSRQIMSEAKLWEAIQEANMELMRRKQAASGELTYALDTTSGGGGAARTVGGADDDAEDEEAPTPARSATASCALPPCYI